MQKLSAQRGIKINFSVIPGADHFFSEHLAEMIGTVESYVDQRLKEKAAEADT